MKKILILSILILNISFSQSLKKIPLIDYVEIVSHTINKPIYISDDINITNVSLFLPTNVSNEILIENLKSSLIETGYRLKKLSNSYIIEKEILKEYHIYKFKNIDIEDFSSLFSVFDNSTFSYMYGSNAVLYKANRYENIEVKKFLELIDIKKDTATIKVSIIRTDLNKLVEFGTKSGHTSLHLNDFTNYIFGIYGTSTTLEAGSILNFKTSFDYLNKNGVSKIEQSPTLYLTNGKSSSVSYVDNIPYQVSKKSVDSTTGTTEETTEYKDVGLKLNVTPKINKDEIFLDFNLISENILNQDTDKPTTRKISLNQSFVIKRGEVILLSGLSKNETNEIIQKVPILGDIPILSFLFKHKEEINQTSIITIMVEYLEN